MSRPYTRRAGSRPILWKTLGSIRVRSCFGSFSLHKKRRPCFRWPPFGCMVSGFSVRRRGRGAHHGNLSLSGQCQTICHSCPNHNLRPISRYIPMKSQNYRGQIPLCLHSSSTSTRISSVGNNTLASGVGSEAVSVGSRFIRPRFSSSLSKMVVEQPHEKQCALKGFLRAVSPSIKLPNLPSLPQNGLRAMRFLPRRPCPEFRPQPGHQQFVFLYRDIQPPEAETDWQKPVFSK